MDEQHPAPTEPPSNSSERLLRLVRQLLDRGSVEPAAAVVRLAHSRDSQHRELRRLAAALDRVRPGESDADVHVALGDAHRVLGDTETARRSYERALERDSSSAAARLRLARLRMPGPPYRRILGALHALLEPEVYVEIGVATGATLALARPPTRAVGIDPAPRVDCDLAPGTIVHPTTTDAFFAREHSDIAGRVTLAFVDGLHEIGQLFRDIANLSRLMAPGGAIAIHDTIPFDELSAGRERQSDFWTGDVWKVVPTLREVVPNVIAATVPTAPSGLTLLAGLPPIDPMGHAEAVAVWAAADFRAYSFTPETHGDILANDVVAIRNWLADVGALSSGDAG